MSLLRRLLDLICALLSRWGLWYCDRRDLVTPVIGVNGAWVRPREVLVDIRTEQGIADRLRALGGRPYVPSDDKDDWRQRPDSPAYGNVNARLDEAKLGFHLWVGFSTRDAVKLALDGELPGVHFNVVYRGEPTGQDYYQGGPRGYATVVTVPPKFPPHTGNGTVDVAVLDTGLPQNWDTDYSDLASAVTEVGAKFDRVHAPGSNVVDEQGCHGLFICGLIARHKPVLDIESHHVMSSTGETDDIMVSMTIPLSTGPVVNLSLGGFSPTNVFSPLMENAVQNAVNNDRILVAAAGNLGAIDPNSPDHDRQFWPAAHPDVIAVGAFDTNPAPSPAEAWASWPLWLWTNRADIYAPGVDLVSMHAQGFEHPNGDVYNGWAKWSGTSFATPVVAAEIATEIVAKAPGSAVSNRQTAEDWLAKQDDPGWLGKPVPFGQPPRDSKKMDPAPILTS